MKIFISHSSKNEDYGRALVKLLTEVGVPHESIVFTSDAAYGVPVGNNIFKWLKAQISDRPFVIFLLSRDYYSSIACLNEMGAAWVVENQHAALFTPDFNLDDPNFRNGALDPREIGFFISNEDRVTEFIDSLRKDFPILDNPLLINRSREEFLKNVGSINSQDRVAGETRGEEAISPQKPNDSNDASIDKLYMPDASSLPSEFKHQFLVGVFSENEAHASKVSEAYLATLGPEDFEAIGEWKSFCELLKLECTEHGDLPRLAALAKEYESNPAVHRDVADGYRHFGDFGKAEAHFRTAIESSKDSNQKLEFLKELAWVVQKRGRREDLSGIVEEMRDLVDDPETEGLLLTALIDLSDWYQDDVLKAAMLERELLINPTDISKRFDLAYLHSKTGNEALAMHHYEKIPVNRRDGATWVSFIDTFL